MGYTGTGCALVLGLKAAEGGQRGVLLPLQLVFAAGLNVLALGARRQGVLRLASLECNQHLLLQQRPRKQIKNFRRQSVKERDGFGEGHFSLKDERFTSLANSKSDSSVLRSRCTYATVGTLNWVRKYVCSEDQS